VAIKAEQDACGETFEVSCDECGDTFVEGCESFEDAVAEGRLLGLTRREGGSLRGKGSYWRNYCAACAHEMETT
jgi:hypothetical protein